MKDNSSHISKDGSLKDNIICHTLEDGSLKVLINFPNENIIKDIAQRYKKTNPFIEIIINKNILEIIYPPDWANIPEEIDNEIDIIISMIENS